MRKRRSVILTGLSVQSQSIVDLHARLIFEVIPIQQSMHCRNFRFLKLKGLEVGETPVGLAKGGVTIDALAVSIDAVVQAAFCFKHVTITQPDLRIGRIFFE